MYVCGIKQYAIYAMYRQKYFMHIFLCNILKHKRRRSNYLFYSTYTQFENLKQFQSI